MLRLGVFCGKYMTDCIKEFPESWFTRAKLAAKASRLHAELFRRRGQPAAVGLAQEGMDLSRRSARLVPVVLPLLMGRRIPAEDARQIKRWKAIRRHVRQVQRNCEPGDVTCRPRQRQALLHWAYDSRKRSRGSRIQSCAQTAPLVEPFALMTALAAGVVRNAMSALPSAAWLAFAGMAATNGVII